MADPKVGEAVDLYRQFMEEIKIRFNAIKLTIDQVEAEGETPVGYLNAEFAFLQLRFVCELIALAVLAAHSPFGLNRRLMKSWNARKTFETLAQINPQCFPRPVKVLRVDEIEDGRNRHHHIDISDAGALKREDLQRIYDHCGETLHRGILKHVVEGPGRVYDLDQVDKWCIEIGALLSHHALLILDRGLVLITVLSTEPNGDVQVVTTQAPGPAIYIPPEDAESSPRPAGKPRRPRAAKRPPKKGRKKMG